MLKYATLASLTLLLLLFSGCNHHDKKKNQQTEVHQQVSNIISLSAFDDANTTLNIKKTPNGFELADDPKKILIFDIYATWCPPCRAEAAVLADIQKKFQKNVTVIGLNVDEKTTDEQLAAYQEKYHADYILTNSPSAQKLIDDIATNLKIGRRFPIPLVAIYKDGKLVNYYSGATEEEFIISDIKQAIGK